MPKIDPNLITDMEKYRDTVLEGYTAVIELLTHRDYQGAANVMADMVRSQANVATSVANLAILAPGGKHHV